VFIQHFDCFDFSSLGYFLIASVILPCHDSMHENTYRSLVEVEFLLHSVPVDDNCDIPLVLYLFQSLLFLFICLYSQLDPLEACYIEALGYTAWNYSVATWYYTGATRCCVVAAQCYNVFAQCCMGLVLD
jgi:hypothetical protein